MPYNVVILRKENNYGSYLARSAVFVLPEWDDDDDDDDDDWMRSGSFSETVTCNRA